MHFHKVLASVVVTFLVFAFSQGRAQTTDPESYKLFVSLENAPFDSLFLQDYTEGRNILIAGRKTKEFTWEITIPKEIVWDSENMMLLATPYDPKRKSQEMIRFVTKKADREVIVANVGVDGANNYIHGKYRDTVVYRNEPFMAKINDKDSLMIGNVICRDFDLIIKDAHSDIAVRAEEPFFSWFLDSQKEGNSYESTLAGYIELTKKHPDSRFLMSSLSRMLARYKSKEDVRKIYDLFSGKHKNTRWAKNIERFLYTNKFPNTSLPPLHDTTARESIVQDTSKYNLVVFTASWCRPCREEIPLLKKIQNDLNKNLILTYVSIDEASGLKSYQKLIEESSIPWRSLLAWQDLKKIKSTYFIEGIPHNILVHPNGDMEKIDVRKDSDREMLYSKVNNP